MSLATLITPTPAPNHTVTSATPYFTASLASPPPMRALIETVRTRAVAGTPTGAMPLTLGHL